MKQTGIFYYKKRKMIFTVSEYALGPIFQLSNVTNCFTSNIYLARFLKRNFQKTLIIPSGVLPNLIGQRGKKEFALSRRGWKNWASKFNFKLVLDCRCHLYIMKIHKTGKKEDRLNCNMGFTGLYLFSDEQFSKQCISLPWGFWNL